ncbi:hypothetical protein [Nocardioides caldifontis]|uniref:hypothetical protein n=1 Tax=Nocardioides caldifontis TaxID=2588938 RepID=UPI0011DFE50B|nr:hypothetical protein [Nocardioides caldifontis]
MRKRSNKGFAGVLAVAGLAVVAGGTAFTASNTGLPATDTVGYGATTVSGAVVNSLSYDYDVPKSGIDNVLLVLDGDTTGATVEFAFNDAAPTTCGVGTYDEVETQTAYTCAAGGFAVSDLAKTAVFVD